MYAIMYTLPVAKIVPVRELRSNLSRLLDDVSDRRDHVLVTRNGKPAAALVPEMDARVKGRLNSLMCVGVQGGGLLGSGGRRDGNDNWSL